MAMDLVMGAVGSLISKLGKLLEEEYKLQKGVPGEIKALIKELKCAHAALHDVAGKPPDQLNKLVKIWACEIREASYDMEDVLDNFLVSAEGGHKHSDHESCFGRLKELAADSYNMVVSGTFNKRRKVTFTIDDINKRLDEAKQRRDRYAVGSIVSKPAATSTIDPRLAAMYTEVTQLVGIGKPSSELISKLSLSQGGEASNKKMKIVSVVGAGGLGKTTLAKAVFNKLNRGVYGHMVSAFVPVGRDPDLKKVFRDILIELERNKYMDLKFATLDERQLIDELRRYLENKRYFIVIDDIWETKSWETIKLALVQNNHGSRVITTTCKLEVAIEAGEVYKLKPLPYDKSKKLFYTRIFGAEDKNRDNQLDGACDKILKKCDGVPLAIITMSSLLVGKSMKEWTEVDNTIAFLDKNNRQANKTEWILSLSYYDLPSHLRTCLLYLSAFPEDYFIDKDMLIRKWVAEGFVHHKPGASYFEVGEGYFNELINRFMIQPEESEFSYGSTDGCRVHDMVLDLLREKSREENFVTISGTSAEGTSSPSTVRRLAYQNRKVEQTHLDTRLDLSHVRTFIACRCDVYLGLSFESFKLLRVLALENCSGWQQNSSIHLEHLKILLHLRYLGLRGTRIRELPEEIGSLKFLETLDLEYTSVKELPYSVCLLTKLIYLHAGVTKVQNGVIDKLTSLEELHIRIDDTVGQFLKDLGKLRALRVLEVQFDSEIMQSDLVEYIGNLHMIRHVKLVARSIRPDQALWDTAVLPRPLRHLSLNWKRFYTLPSCINPSVLTNLSQLDLGVKSLDEQCLKILGGLPELRYLSLMTDSTVTVTIHASDGLFQKLTYLVVPLSMLQFAPNEDSSISLTIWNGKDDMAFGSKTRDKCTVAPDVLRNLKVLHFCVKVQALVRNRGSCENLGLENLPFLQKVQVDLWGYDASADDVDKEKAALWHAFEAHPNEPRLENYLFLDEREAAIWDTISFD